VLRNCIKITLSLKITPKKLTAMRISRIFQVLVPKEKKFFPLFEADVENIVDAALLLNKLLLSTDPEMKEKYIAQIKDHEKKGDDITHQIFDELNKTFITPFDREDIYKLNSSLDDVLDYINGVALKIKMYKPKNIRPEFIELSELILFSCRELKNAITGLRDLKHPQKIKEHCIRINEIENQADDIYHYTISELFDKEKDAIELIKQYEIIQNLEKATDIAEDVSDVIKTIIVKIA